MRKFRQGPKGRPKVVFKTPGRECAHVDAGCCPKCFDPGHLLGRRLKRKGDTK